MVGNQILALISKVGIGGKVDAAAVALGAVVSDRTTLHIGRAFQQQAAAATRIVIETGEIVFNAAVVNLQFAVGTGAMPAHGTSIVFGDVRVVDGKGCLVVANGSDGAVGVVDSSGTAHGKIIRTENVLELAVLDDGLAFKAVNSVDADTSKGLHSEDRRTGVAFGANLIEIAMVQHEVGSCVCLVEIHLYHVSVGIIGAEFLHGDVLQSQRAFLYPE